MQETKLSTEQAVVVDGTAVKDDLFEEKESPCARYEQPGYWKLQGQRIKKYRKVLWFIIPAALFTLIFSYIPMFGIFFAFKSSYSLKNDVLTNLFGGSWTFQNFIDIFSGNDQFWRAIGNTLIINVIRLVICFPLSILIALQLAGLKNQGVAKLILIILCIPNFLSWAIVIQTWGGMLDSQGGILNELLIKLGLNQPDHFIMKESGFFKPFAIFLSAWKGAGWGCILYYAAIVAIDTTFYEAATLEGANRLRKAWSLTVPMISATIALNLVLNFAGMLAAGFEEIWTLMQYSASLRDSQITLDTYIYEISIVDKSNVPLATALGVFNGLIALALMLIGNKITTKTMKRGLW